MSVVSKLYCFFFLMVIITSTSGVLAYDGLFMSVVSQSSVDCIFYFIWTTSQSSLQYQFLRDNCAKIIAVALFCCSRINWCIPLMRNRSKNDFWFLISLWTSKANIFFLFWLVGDATFFKYKRIIQKQNFSQSYLFISGICLLCFGDWWVDFLVAIFFFKY